MADISVVDERIARITDIGEDGDMALGWEDPRPLEWWDFLHRARAAVAPSDLIVSDFGDGAVISWRRRPLL